jgi:hypothetical protein
MPRERTYRCWRCWDQGYQSIWSFRRAAWSAASRPCSCPAAPAFNRSENALEPSEIWIRGEFGDYASADTLLRFGAPNAGFEKWLEQNRPPEQQAA